MSRRIDPEVASAINELLDTWPLCKWSETAQCERLALHYDSATGDAFDLQCCSEHAHGEPEAPMANAVRSLAALVGRVL
jgi:hypothetical protein